VTVPPSAGPAPAAAIASGPPSPFEDSRRLLGPNLFFAPVGVVLEAVAPSTPTPDALATWKREVASACAALGWPAPTLVARTHAGGASLAFTAPEDQLFTATEVNEWAWQRACALDAGFHAPGHPRPDEVDDALACLRAQAAGEREPALMALLAAAQARGVPVYLDDDVVALGDGAGSAVFVRADPPRAEAIDWPRLHAMPKALVTGSNGKTTTVRLIAALCRAHGWRTGHSCTDGLFVDGARLQAGDYSGPVGARTLLRQPTLDAAVLETARGGILRRGLAVRDAHVAVVTNVSADHFGEYGIHALDDLAAAKLAVAHGRRAGAPLVLNADDATLARQARAVAGPLAWFALDDTAPALVAARGRGEATAGWRDGVLWLRRGDASVELGHVGAMPLALGGLATYNLANLAAAALAADALGLPAATIAAGFARFGQDSGDNPGRLQRWRLGDATVLLDYAHNPDGLAGFLRLATALRGEGRLGLVLGQAGNRPDDDIRALARTAARFAPARIVLKDIDGFLRGRAPGEVPDLLEAELLGGGFAREALSRELPEFDAARALLAWARPRDVLALPIHALRAREAVVGLLDQLQASGWRPGEPLPARGAPPVAPSS
jgi:UDP-N-acetylmuramyl tripeptide synthase